MTAQTRPEWVKRVVDDLADASMYGHDHLTENEQHLISAASLLLRARFGHTVLSEEDAHEVLVATLRTVLRALDEEEQEGSAR